MFLTFPYNSLIVSKQSMPYTTLKRKVRPAQHDEIPGRNCKIVHAILH